MLACTSLYTGLMLTFWSYVYGTAISRTFGDSSKVLVGVHGIVSSFGEVIGGTVQNILGWTTFFVPYQKTIWSPISFRSLFWFDPGLLTSHENSNHGWENYWKSGVQIPVPEGSNIFVLFSFLFQILHKKNCISLFLTIFEYLVLQIRYQ